MQEVFDELKITMLVNDMNTKLRNRYIFLIWYIFRYSRMPMVDQQNPQLILNEIIPALIRQNEDQIRQGTITPEKYDLNRLEINKLTNYAREKLDAEQARLRQGPPPPMASHGPPRHEFGQGPPPHMAGGPRPGPWMAGQGPPQMLGPGQGPPQMAGPGQGPPQMPFPNPPHMPPSSR